MPNPASPDPSTRPARRGPRFALLAAHGVCALALALAAWSSPSPWWLIPAWGASGAALVACAYVFNWPQVFAKRADGTRGWLRALPILPVLLVTSSIWRLLTALRRVTPYHQVADGLWLGGLVPPDTLPADVTLVVDLTCEHTRPRGGGTRAYRTLPTLDAWGPRDAQAFGHLARDIARTPAGVYVHCASGRGRAPSLMAAVFVLKGLAVDIDDALHKIRAVRRVASPTAEQRALAQQALALLGA